MLRKEKAATEAKRRQQEEAQKRAAAEAQTGSDSPHRAHEEARRRLWQAQLRLRQSGDSPAVALLLAVLQTAAAVGDITAVSRAVPALARAKANGLDITAGTSIHHLTLNEFDVAEYRSPIVISPKSVAFPVVAIVT